MKKIKGYTNIELLLVVGILSVLTGSIYFIYNNASDKRIVSSELTNLQDLVKKLGNATTSSSYASLSNQQLTDFGIYYHSEFQDFKIEGLSLNSFKVNYSGLNARQCNDFALKTAAMKGEYVVTRDINGKATSDKIDEIVSNCNNDLNKVSITFSGMSIPALASVTPGTPKPPPVYAGEGTLNPAYPDRGDVPTNLGSSGKNVNNPGKPIPGTYTPPTYVVAGTPTPGGGATNPGSFTRPTYPSNNPLGPLYNPPDLGNEWVPATPPTPPRPPATVPPAPPPAVVQKRTITLCTIACTPTEVSFKDGYLSVVDFWGCYREQYFIFGSNNRIPAFEFKHYVGSVLYETDPWGFGTQSRLMTQSEFDSLNTWHLNCGRPDAGS